MANMCINRIEFIGEHSQFEALEKFFGAMAEKERLEGRGQQPDFVADKDGGYFFEVAWFDGVLYYQTRWSPNTAVLVEIAKHFGVGFVLNYDEMGNLVYGEATYKDGVLTDVCLDGDDHDQFTYDEDADLYTFERSDYESQEDILEILLARKKAAILDSNSTK